MRSDSVRFAVLRERLLCGGIAPRHVRRYLAELGDHLEDLTMAQHAAGHDAAAAALRARALLGSEDELAAAMLARPQLRSLTARAPWLVFGLIPLLATVTAFFALALALVAIGWAHDMIGPHELAAPGWFRCLALCVTLSGNLLLGPLAAALMVGLARQRRAKAAWPLLGVLLIGLLGMQVLVRFPAPGHTGGRMGIGPMLEMIFHHHALPWPWMATQSLLTLLPAAWLARKTPCPV